MTQIPGHTDIFSDFDESENYFSDFVDSENGICNIIQTESSDLDFDDINFYLSSADVEFLAESSDDSSGKSELALNLSKWVTRFNIPHAAVKDLLIKLHPFHPTLPKDPRTLL